jgi:hypothetical protein
VLICIYTHNVQNTSTDTDQENYCLRLSTRSQATYLYSVWPYSQSHYTLMYSIFADWRLYHLQRYVYHFFQRNSVLTIVIGYTAPPRAGSQISPMWLPSPPLPQHYGPDRTATAYSLVTTSCWSQHTCNAVHRYYTTYAGAPGLLPSAHCLPWQYTYCTIHSGLTWVHGIWCDERDLVIERKIHCILYSYFTLRYTIWWWPL